MIYICYIYVIYIFIRQYYVIQKPLIGLDFMIGSRVFVMQHVLITKNSQGTQAALMKPLFT